MPRLIVAQPWLAQPQEAAEIDRTNPLTVGLVGAINTGALDEPLIRTSTPDARLTAGPLGRAFVGNNGSALYVRRLAAAPGSAATLLYVGNLRNSTALVQPSCPASFGNPGTSSNGMLIVAANNAAGAAAQARLIVRPTTGNDAIRTVSGSTSTSDYTDNDVWVGVWGGTSASARIFRNGEDVSGTLTTSGAGATSAFDADITQLSLGGARRAQNLNTVTGQAIYLVLGWNRMLSDAEVAAISANPWQVFATRYMVAVPSIKTVAVPAVFLRDIAVTPAVSAGTTAVAAPVTTIRLVAIAPAVSPSTQIAVPPSRLTLNAVAPARTTTVTLAVTPVAVRNLAITPTVVPGTRTLTPASVAVRLAALEPTVFAGIAVPPVVVTLLAVAPSVTGGGGGGGINVALRKSGD